MIALPHTGRRRRGLLSLTLFFALSLMFHLACHSFHPGPLPNAPEDATYAMVDGVRLHYTDEGQGPAVVLIHGFGSSLEIWHRVVPALRGKHRVIAVDLKGFGWSGRPKGNYSPAEQARLVLLLLDQLGVEKADIVGHSWGASVTLALALQDMNRVNKLALYGAWVYEEQLPPFFLWARSWGIGEFLFSAFYGERMDEQLEYAYFDADAITEERAAAVKAMFRRPGTKAAALTAVRDQHYAEVQKHYKKIQRPTLILWGRDDRVARLHFGERLSRDLPDAVLKTYPRCGHIPMIEAAEVTTRDLVQFIDEGER